MKTIDRTVWKLGITSGLALLYVVTLRLLDVPLPAPAPASAPAAPDVRSPPAVQQPRVVRPAPARVTRPAPVRVVKRRARVRTRSS